MSDTRLKNLNELAESNITGVISLGGLLKSRLIIPDYQRPYVWRKEQVEILLNDLDEQMSGDSTTEKYMLGSLILYENNGKFEVVDGQQRLVTLALILRVLCDSDSVNFLGDSEFQHNDSKAHINENYYSIKSWFETRQDKKENFKQNLQDKIEFICILAPSLDDAFTFFDSANAKGKRLEGYDLVKAFHLRALETQNCTDLIKAYAKDFEALSKSESENKEPPIKILLNDILAPARIWLRDRGELANATHSLIAKHIYDEFCKEFPANLKAKAQKSVNSLGILQGFMGGADFFEFIAHFNGVYEKLLLSEFYEKNIANINFETGFTDNRLIYIMAMLIYFDKFSNGSADYMFRLIARAVFSLRVEKDRVGEATIKKFVKNEKILSLIYFADTEQELESELLKFIDDRILIEKDREKETDATKVYLERVQGLNKNGQRVDYKKTEYGCYGIVPHPESTKKGNNNEQ